MTVGSCGSCGLRMCVEGKPPVTRAQPSSVRASSGHRHPRSGGLPRRRGRMRRGTPAHRHAGVGGERACARAGRPTAAARRTSCVAGPHDGGEGEAKGARLSTARGCSGRTVPSRRGRSRYRRSARRRRGVRSPRRTARRRVSFVFEGQLGGQFDTGRAKEIEHLAHVDRRLA